METAKFLDLFIELHGISTEKFIEKLSSYIEKRWLRDVEREKYGERIAGIKGYCFEHTPSKDIPGAGLCLFEKEPGVLYVPNVIPTKKTEFTCEEYNQVLMDFYTVIIPVICDSQVRVSIGEITI